MGKKMRLYTGPGEHDCYEFEAPESQRPIASRSTAANEWTYDMALPNPDPVLRKMGKSIEVYEDLLSDARIGSNVENRQAGLLSQSWEVERDQSTEAITTFVRDVLADLPVEAITSEMLEAPLFGYKVLEASWEYLGKRLVPKRVDGKPQKWFGFDDENRLRFLTKSDPNKGLDCTLPEYRQKFILCRNKPSYSNPYGVPVLARCFWSVVFKKGGWKFWAKLCEKYGIPYLLGHYRDGASDAERAKMLAALQSMIQDAVAIVPQGTTVEILDFKNAAQSGELFERLCRYSDEQATIAILGHPGTSQSTPGRLGGEDSALEVRKDIVEADKRIVVRGWQDLIDWTVELNFGENARAPRYAMYEPEEVGKEQAERDQILSKTGVRFRKRYFVRTYNFEEDDIEVTAPETEQSGAAAAEFARGDNSDPSQAAIDTLVDGLPARLLQEQAENALRPVIELVNGAASIEEIQLKVAELFPSLNTAELEQTLERTMFLAETHGRSLPTDD